MAQQAQDTFVAVLDDGTERFVAKGEPFSDNHELVKRDLAASAKNPERTPLFRRLDLDGEEEPPAKSPPAAKAEPARAAPAKAAAARAVGKGS